MAFSINHLLNYAGENFKRVEYDYDQNNKFALYRSKSRFEIKTLKGLTDPESALFRLFAKTIQNSKSDAEKKGLNPDRIGFSISSINLNPDIHISFSKITSNVLHAVYNRFLHVENSKEQQQSLLGEPFTLTITLMDSAKVPKQNSTFGTGRNITNKRHLIDTSKLITINNNDRYCLFYALLLAKVYTLDYMFERKMDNRDFHYFLNNQKQIQKIMVRDLMERANIQTNLPSYDAETYCPKIEQYWQTLYPNTFKIFIFREYGDYRPIYTSNITKYKHEIILFHHDNHFDAVRTMNLFFNNCKKYCFTCLMPYNKDADHNLACRSKCHNCQRRGASYPCPPTKNYTMRCNKCHKSFDNMSCFNYHQSKGICATHKKCLKCGVQYNMKDLKRNKQQKHECEIKFCKICFQMHKGHCFMQPPKLKKPDPYRICFFDFETQQNKEILDTSGRKRFIHIPNFVGLYVACSLCIENGTWNTPLPKPCKICGLHRSISFAPFEFTKTKVDQQITTQNPLHSFVDHILAFNPKHKTVMMAHNGGRFDTIMVFKDLIERNITPEMIRRGNKLIELTIKKDKRRNIPEIYFRDSYNLAPFALSKFVKAFGLSIEEKRHFPHYYNEEKNYHINLPHLPPLEYYRPDSKKPEEREALLKWHKEHYNESFQLSEKLAEYCMSDVEILTHGMIKMREECMNLIGPEEDAMEVDDERVGYDILWFARTIASACIQIYTSNFLKPDTLGIVPNNCYNTFGDNQSEIALKFMRYLEEERGITIRTAESDEGEFKIPGTNYKLDGYVEGNPSVGIEVHGCMWHACPKCFTDPQYLLQNGKTVELTRREHNKRMGYIKNIMHIEEYWECEINQMKESDPVIKKRFANYLVTTPALRIREGFCGGRTAPARNYFEAKDGWIMKYKDYTSLYPYTQTLNYPIKHPKMIVVPKNERYVHWTKPEDIKWKGFLKVVVYCPRGVNPPVTVLPMKLDERLLFCTCRSCAIEYPDGARLENYSCQHTNEQREFLWTGTSIELAKALEEGYIVRQVYSALEYEEWSDDLFADYVSTFMSKKFHSSGFETNVYEDQEKFIAENLKMFNIIISRDKILPDAAKRSMTKLFLNSLWGKMAQRNDLTKSFVTDSPATLRKYMDDPAIEVNDVEPLNDDIVLITYQTKKEFIESNKHSNIGIAAWTTSMARLKLFEALKAVASSGGILLYYDTDSVIYSYKEGTPDPLEFLSGPHLGQLKDEKPDDDILEYVSGGPKNYALKMRNKKTGHIYYDMKVRGITLDFNTCEKLHYEEFKKRCLAFGGEPEETTMQVEYESFMRPNLAKGHVLTMPLSKMFRPVVRKGILGEDHQILEFGYCKPF